MSLIWWEVAILWQRRRSAITFLGSLKSRAGVTKPSRKFPTIQRPFNNLYYSIDSPEIPKVGECLTIGRLTRFPLNQDKYKVSYYFHSKPTVKWHKLAKLISKGYNLAWWLHSSLLSIESHLHNLYKIKLVFSSWQWARWTLTLKKRD